jgi:predicted alpha/beta-hydrolase family hydrolase
MNRSREMRIVLPNGESVSALFDRRTDARALLLMAHGAGAGMSHPFMQAASRELNTAGIATLRYQFPYMEKRRRIPDPPSSLTATVRAAAERASELAPDLPVFAGGKSMGGRMTSMAAAESPLANVRGLVFLGFPLHPPNRPGTKRAAHLAHVTLPMLFLQGSRDAFAGLDLLQPICAGLGPRATLCVFEGADHSFHVCKGSGTSDSEVFQDLIGSAVEWMDATLR